MAYTVVRTDNLSGIIDGSKLVTARYNNGTNYNDPIENGVVLKLSYIDNNGPERLTWVAVAPTSDSGDQVANGTLVLIATPEMIYDKKYFNLNEYRNKPGEFLRGYVLEQGDVFSITKEGFVGNGATAANIPAVGGKVEIGSGGKLKKNDSGTFAKCIKTDTVGGETYYVLRCL